MEREVLPQLASEQQLYSMALEGYWMNVKQPRDFLQDPPLAPSLRPLPCPLPSPLPCPRWRVSPPRRPRAGPRPLPAVPLPRRSGPAHRRSLLPAPRRH